MCRGGRGGGLVGGWGVDVVVGVVELGWCWVWRLCLPLSL